MAQKWGCIKFSDCVQVRDLSSFMTVLLFQVARFYHSVNVFLFHLPRPYHPVIVFLFQVTTLQYPVNVLLFRVTRSYHRQHFLDGSYEDEMIAREKYTLSICTL